MPPPFRIGVRQLTKDSAGADTPSWSPDGSKILFMSRRTGWWTVWVMNADGSDQHTIARSADTNAEPTWSPDGSKVVFERRNDEGVSIIVADADGGHESVVAAACAKECSDEWPRPAWQPIR